MCKKKKKQKQDDDQNRQYDGCPGSIRNIYWGQNRQHVHLVSPPLCSRRTLLAISPSQAVQWPSEWYQKCTLESKQAACMPGKPSLVLLLHLTHYLTVSGSTAAIQVVSKMLHCSQN